MRIIGGKHKGRNIEVLNTFKDRPTTDIAKEALFNIVDIRYEFDNLAICDLFTGTGSISFEFASRGVGSVTCVDSNRQYINHISKQAKQLFPNLNLIAINADVFEFVKKHPLNFDIIFADPPYDMENIELLPKLIFENKYFNTECLVIIEHSKRLNFQDIPQFKQERKYGKVHFSFFTNSDF